MNISAVRHSLINFATRYEVPIVGDKRVGEKGSKLKKETVVYSFEFVSFLFYLRRNGGLYREYKELHLPPSLAGILLGTILVEHEMGSC